MYDHVLFLRARGDHQPDSETCRMDDTQPSTPGQVVSGRCAVMLTGHEVASLEDEIFLERKMGS